MNESKLVNGLYDWLTSQDFYDWYNGAMDKHILGEEDDPGIEQIKADIASTIEYYC